MLEQAKSRPDCLGETGADETMLNQQVTELEFGWLIGFLDGEGCCNLYWNQKQEQVMPRVDFSNNEPPLVERCVSILKRMGVGCFVLGDKNKRRSPRHQPSYRVTVAGIKRCATFLRQVMPYWDSDTLKRKRGELVLQFCELRLSRPGFAKNFRKVSYSKEEYEIFRLAQELRGKSSEAMSPPVKVSTEDMVQA